MSNLATGNPASLALSEVTRGERVIWADRAIRRRPGWGVMPIVLVGLCVAAFGGLWSLIAWSATASETSAWRFFPLFGLIFVVIGLLIATVPLWLRLVGGPTLYALTERRIMMIYGRGSRTVRSVAFDAIGDLQMTAESDGTGNILFGEVFAAPAESRATMFTGIYGIPNVRRVRDLIEREKRRVAQEQNRTDRA
jgi:hypothetical protein